MWRTTLLKLTALALGVAFLAGCGPKYPNCETDKHCAEHGEYCVNGKCVQCADDSNCGAACQVCSTNNTCEKKAGCCTNDLDCPGGKCWATGDTGVCGPKCSADHPCPAGQRCAGGQCVPDVECTDNSQCPAGQQCDTATGRCVAACQVEVVTFDFDEYVLTSEGQRVAQSNADCLKTKAGSVTLEGHCDERGTDEYNLALGNRRARSVKDTLTRLGVSSDRLRTISFGEERPVCTSSNEGCWSRNRRVETKIR